MNDFKFTPGPWRLGADMETVCLNHGDANDYTRNGFAKAICKVKQNSWRDIEEAVATGHLISAAPELYDVLREATVALDGFARGEGVFIPIEQTIRAAYSVLAKARGERS